MKIWVTNSMLRQACQAGVGLIEFFMNHKSHDPFHRWLAEHRPLASEILPDTFPAYLRGMSFTELTAFRYRETLKRLIPSVKVREGDRLLDIGPYPGGWDTLLLEQFGPDITLDLLGLGLTDEFKNRMPKACCRFIDFDVDLKNPICRNPDHSIPISPATYRVVTLLETIEHCYDPLPLLEAIHAGLMPDGRLMITTDNPSWFGFAYQSLRYQRSIWGPVQESHVFNRSNWRPHIRLYTLDDLTYMLNHVGMEVIASGYFNDHFGLYHISHGELRFRPGFRPMISKLPSFFLPLRIWANRIWVIAGPTGSPG